MGEVLLEGVKFVSESCVQCGNAVYPVLDVGVYLIHLHKLGSVQVTLSRLI